MTDPLHKDAGRGLEAEALLNNELLTEAFASLDRDYLEAWKATGARDTDARERLWQAIQIVGKVRSHLIAAVNNGTLARRELDEIALMGERKKIFGVV